MDERRVTALPRPPGPWKPWLEVLGATVLLALVLRLAVLDAYRIPTASMADTLLPGDFLLVNKLVYGASTPRTLPFTSVALPSVRLPGFRPPARGDVVVFALDGTTYVKRCVAVPGDTVMVRGGVTSVNGVSVPLPEHARRSDPRGHPPIPDVGPLRVPRRGDRMKADRATGLFLLRMIERDGHAVGVTGTGGLLVDGIPSDAYTVQDDQYFMLGDNRDNSLDSRLEGFVPASGIIGKAMMVYWSRGSGEGGEASGGIRWARLGRIVR